MNRAYIIISVFFFAINLNYFSNNSLSAQKSASKDSWTKKIKKLNARTSDAIEFSERVERGIIAKSWNNSSQNYYNIPFDLNQMHLIILELGNKLEELRFHFDTTTCLGAQKYFDDMLEFQRIANDYSSVYQNLNNYSVESSGSQITRSVNLIEESLQHLKKISEEILEKCTPGSK